MSRPILAVGESTGRHGGGTDRITPREWEVLALMAEGRSNAGIAAALALSLSAVAKHINSIFTKLGIPPTENDNRRVLAVLRYLHTINAHGEAPTQGPRPPRPHRPRSAAG